MWLDHVRSLSSARRPAALSMLLAGASLLFGCEGSSDSADLCADSALQSLACAEAQSPAPLPPTCATDCAALDGPAAAEALMRTAGLTPDGLLARYPAQFAGELGYDPGSAANLGRITGTTLQLSGDEQAALQRNGFLISGRSRFPTFAYGYQTLYMHDLPVFISADSILHAVHRSYDDILATLERKYLMAEVQALLSELHTQLLGSAAAGFSAPVLSDADVYLATARSLLADSVQSPLGTGSAAAVRNFFDLAKAAAGPQQVDLFGSPVEVDFSQFTPRGHYADDPELQRYFRCMMWLGRIELRIAKLDPMPSIQRRPLELAFLLTRLHSASAQTFRQHIDSLLRTLIGEPDDMTPEQMTSLLAALSVTTPAELAMRTDAEVWQAISTGNYGVQRIVSQILENGTQQTMPPPRSFLLMGQRYVPDSHVLSNVVYDRAGGGAVRRMMPSPLDVAFAALRNNQAAQLLRPELDRYPYAPDLAAMRVLLDGHGADYWQTNLYTAWLGALRALSPDGTAATPAAYGLPMVAGTEAWGRRLLNTQLASWAELRHDTILYSKQSYSASALCEFPDAYVDPYPRFYEAVALMAARGTATLRALSSSVSVVEQAAQHFERISEVARMLQEMAELQRAHKPFTATHLAFVNEMVTVSKGCQGFKAPGWYLKMFWDRDSADEYKPTIADVHTQPTDEVGNPVGRILHVATGDPRLMVVTADTCQGVRAYFGLASSYHEVTTDSFKRLDDEQWQDQLRKSPPADVEWLRSVVAQ